MTDRNHCDHNDPDDGDATADLPAGAIEEAERLTRLARDAVDPDERAAYRERRAEAVAEHGYAVRVREEDAHAVLVCYPADWLDEGIIRTDRIDDLDRAVERPLSGPGNPDDWDEINAYNRSIAARVADRHGSAHGANAGAFADFMGNHYARPVDSASAAEIDDFLAEYFPRNAWPTAEQEAVVETSIDLLFDVASDDDAGDVTDGSTTDDTATDDATGGEAGNGDTDRR